ncbi:MAG TPA: 5-formyltetrahydrofolate cyclo-ligase [Tenuifilaceae bacterium]|nr:5-formyltetrahydrofolate cyclo-ligase [Tenuifilaceae bacterium]HPJ44668.1 5-formyltetrahydrofolate cyclo-ligase [Tenuifilaceae bacterium]
MNSLKIEQRKIIKSRKLAADRFEMEAASKKIFAQVEQVAEFKNAKNVLAYWSLPDEVDTHNFVVEWHKIKTISLPVVAGANLELCIFSGMECMKKTGSFGILEPTGTEIVDPNDIEVAIVPGMAFDMEGNRLGRGKGFYDSLLQNKNIYKIGVCFEFQLLEKVATSPHDIPMDKVIYV